MSNTRVFILLTPIHRSAWKHLRFMDAVPLQILRTSSGDLYSNPPKEKGKNQASSPPAAMAKP